MDLSTIQDRLEDIAKHVIHEISDSRSNVNINMGLFDGGFGILLFLAYYKRYKNNQIANNAFNYYSRTLLKEFGNSIPSSHTYCSGISGILLLIRYLQRRNMLHIDISEAEGLLEHYILECMYKDFDRQSFDFMHGALGIGFYFIEKKEYQYVNYIVNFLFELAEKDHSNMKWKSVLYNNPTIYNISLSHGMSSIIMFLCSAHQCVHNDRIMPMLRGAIRYIFLQEINLNKYGSFFPPFSVEVSIQKSRLAWCYGDLGIALSLLRASEIIQDTDVRNKAMDILYFSTTRLDLKENNVTDNCICHGAAGLYMIFRRVYLDTGDILFNQTADYWLQQIINSPIHIKNDNLSLLNGISGVGLVLISFLMNDQQDWDSFFLLS